MGAKGDELRQLLGERSATWLAAVGIHHLQQVQQHGPVAVAALAQAAGYPVSLNLVYALHAALSARPWNALEASERAQLSAAWRSARARKSSILPPQGER